MATDGIYRYEIRVKGEMQEYWLSRFSGLDFSLDAEGNTCMLGCMDQATLFGILNLICDIGMRLDWVMRHEEEYAR